MKTALAVVVALIFLVAGWLFLSALLYAVGYVASNARDGIGLMRLLHVLLMWVLGPGFGGFLATYITPRLFKQVGIAIIFTSFVSVVITLAIILGLLSLVFVQQGKIGIGEFVLLIVQVSAIIVGAKIGKSVAIDDSA